MSEVWERGRRERLECGENGRGVGVGKDMGGKKCCESK